jgi:5'-methylthioadenosine phosphorylase
VLGILTGSGSYALPGFRISSAAAIRTPYGSVAVKVGWFGAAEVAHVSRHGDGHRMLSHQVEHKANVWALKEVGVEAVLAATVCGCVDPSLSLGSLVVFDDLHFLSNRLADGTICTFYDQPGQPGRGHWIFQQPFSESLRSALIETAARSGHEVAPGGCYGHVDGPRFNSASEIRSLAQVGVTAISQTAGPETVLCGELEMPYALVGYLTDYANGVMPQVASTEDLQMLIQRSGPVLAGLLRETASAAAQQSHDRVGSTYRFS